MPEWFFVVRSRFYRDYMKTNLKKQNKTKR